MTDLYNILLAFTGLLVVISFYAGAITYKHVKVTRNRSLRVFVLSWFSWSLGYMCIIISSIVNIYYPNDVYPYWKFIIIASFVFQIYGTFNLILFVDENSKSSIGLVKTTVVSIIGSLYVILPFVTDQLHYNMFTIYHMEGTLLVVQTAFGIFYFLQNFEWIFRIWKNAPKNLKKVTNILLITFSTSSVLAILAYLSSVFYHWHMVFLYVFHGASILSIVIAIRMEPTIINILPFVANRVLVINKTSGVLLYEFAWTDEDMRNLASFIHGIQRVSQDTFQIGELKELNLGEGLVLLDYSEELTYALLTTKSTKYLQLCFRNFKEAFEKTANDQGLKLDGVINTADFRFGDKLVESYFKYIPSRRVK